MESDEFINWLCWMWAQDGQRFYPPEETAQECMDEWESIYEEAFDDETLEHELACGYQWELGQHSRAYTEAVDKFDIATMHEFDPVERAARYHRELMNESDNVEPLDWRWYDADR